MLKKGLAFLCIFALLVPLCGCQLAKEEAQQGSGEGRMIGMFITWEPLDLFDMEAFLNDNIGGIADGGDVIADHASGAYNGRLYATLQEQTVTSEESGEPYTLHEYVFEGLEGLSFFSARHNVGSEEYISSTQSEGVSAVHLAQNVSDTGTTTSLEGTIYVVPGTIRILYFNPVYQMDDGSVYLTSGTGMACDQLEDGMRQSVWYDETSTITEQGETKNAGFNIKCNIEGMYAPEKIVLQQMDENHALIESTAFRSEDVPDTIMPLRKAAYCVLETYAIAQGGEKTVRRTLLEKTDTYMETFHPLASGVCAQKQVEIKW
ncbi:hypothetical protein LJC07_01940 [Christensenellaceae bacterium OttesenSCG-928-L17]|nr:hypothetical protein [Christensenellaceae bacterium OttesenSCG-928-L17]